MAAGLHTYVTTNQLVSYSLKFYKISYSIFAYSKKGITFAVYYFTNTLLLTNRHFKRYKL